MNENQSIVAVTDYLDEKGITYELMRHPAVFSCEESRRIVCVENCCACKNLFVKDAKSGFFYLIILRSDKHADLKMLALSIGAGRFVFATDEELFDRFKVTHGMVSPFGFLNDSEGKTRLMIDNDVLNSERVKFHPNDNTATVILTQDNFRKYLECVRKYIIKV